METIEHYQHALEIKTKYADTYNNMGVTLFQAGQLQEEIEHYEPALRLRSDY